MAGTAPIYLDNAATTPVDPRVVRAVAESLGDPALGNATSRHPPGRHAAERIEAAAEAVAAAVGARPEELIWTSGATEANNLAIRGLIARCRRLGRGTHVIAPLTEHDAVRSPLRGLEREGVAITWLEVDADGRVPADALEAALRPETALVCLMAVNNETGLCQDVAGLAAIVHEQSEARVHVDAAQGVGRVPIDVRRLGADLVALSAHKCHGPAGVGALWRRPEVHLEPLLLGGGQQGGLRSGTLPVHQIVGMGEAYRLVDADRGEPERLRRLCRRLIDGLGRLPGVSLNGADDARAPHILNLRIEGVHAESLLAATPGVALSTGSACSTARAQTSHVLKAMGMSDTAIQESVRLSVGRFTTEQAVDSAVEQLTDAIAGLRRVSSRWTGHAAADDARVLAVLSPIFANERPPRPGPLEGGDVFHGASAGRDTAAAAELWLRMQGERIVDAAFRAYGEPAALLCAAAMAQGVLGRRVDEASRMTGLELVRALALPSQSTGLALGAEDALGAALDAWRRARMHERRGEQ